MPILATLKLETPAPPQAALLELDDRSEASVSGDPVVLIGYPTGIEGILARAGSDVTQKVVENAHQVTQIVSQLAAQHLIRPTTTQDTSATSYWTRLFTMQRQPPAAPAGRSSIATARSLA